MHHALREAMKIYTKKGDKGETSLWGGKRTSKDSLRISAYGTVDELISVLGWIRAEVGKDQAVPLSLRQRVSEWVFAMQKDLFLTAEALAKPEVKASSRLDKEHRANTAQLERLIDEWGMGLPRLKHFVIPGGEVHSARFHMARTVARRAERLAAGLSRQEKVLPSVIAYLNRLSDALFMLARRVVFEFKYEEAVLN